MKILQRRRLVSKLALAVMLSGVFFGIVTHELFHIALHWGNISEIKIFNGQYIVSIIAKVPTGYNIVLEEIVAYIITIITMIAFVYFGKLINERKYNKNKECL